MGVGAASLKLEVPSGGWGGGGGGGGGGGTYKKDYNMLGSILESPIYGDYRLGYASVIWGRGNSADGLRNEDGNTSAPPGSGMIEAKAPFVKCPSDDKRPLARHPKPPSPNNKFFRKLCFLKLPVAQACTICCVLVG